MSRLPWASACRALLLVLPFALSSPAGSAGLPSNVNLIVGYPPGGSVDIVARVLAQPLADELGVKVIVDNRPGAGGRLAAGYVKNAKADGSFVMIAPNAVTTVATLVYEGKLNYDMRKDFTPVSRIASYPFALSVSASSDVKSPSDLALWLKQHPDQANYGSPGAGGMAHFTGLLYAQITGVPWTHVPYAGGAPLLTSLIGGHVIAGVDTVVDHYEQYRAGKLRILGLFSSDRYTLTPDIPTLEEQGVKGMNVKGSFGAFAPAGTSPEVVARYDEAFRKVLANPGVVKKLNDLVLETAYLPRDAFRQAQADELALWAPVIKASGFAPE